MESICWSGTGVEQQVSQFQSEVFQLHLSAALQVHPIVVNCLVQELDGQKAVLSLSGLESIGEANSTLHIPHLLPGKVKTSSEKSGQTLLLWEKRVYNSVDLQNARAPPGTVDLTTDRLMHSIPALHWQKLLGATRERKEPEIVTCIKEISSLVVDADETMMNNHPEVISGFHKDGQMRHYVPFTFALHEGQPLTVQLSAEIRDGLLRPSIQLLSVTPMLEICLEHQRNGIKCFAGICSPDPPQISTTNDTLQTVFPLLRGLAEECAENAVLSGERITVHSVQIAWRTESLNGAPIVYGEFILSEDFCRISCFKPDLGAHVASGLVNGQQILCEDWNYCLDYLCVRYTQMDVPDEPVLEESVAAVVNIGMPVTWVGHCRVVDVSPFTNGVVVKVALVQSSMNMPQLLLSDNGLAVPSTIEWIRKTWEHRLMDISVRSLHLASTFAQEVFTGKKPTNLIDPLPQDNSVLKSQLSEEQENMISAAFQQPFTAIIGGPGTGKSLCAARLAHLLVQRNRTADKIRQTRPDGAITQLMICAATELSLDVITGLIKVFNLPNIRIVRVYGDEVEQRDFPISTAIKPAEFETNDSTCAVSEDIALHHLIRKEDNPESNALLEMEFLTMSGGSLEPKFIHQFRICLDRAQAHELRKAHIILCTCATSARPILRQATCVRQVIMDDAGLIAESLSMVPLVAHRQVNQLVVLGDTQMPGVASKVPGHSAVSRSLLTRFANQAVTLTQQYRTVTGLCSFPSQQFYNGMLTTSAAALNLPPEKSIPWPGDFDLPSVFCHLEGVESEAESSSSAEDNVLNEKEAIFVNELVMALTRYHGVKETSIHVLTMTRAQSDQIKQLMTQNVEVSTVLDAMGRESEYVILSCVRSLAREQLHQPQTSEWVKGHLGRAAEPSVLNLAITRANIALFIVGNKHLLNTSAMWAALLKTYKDKHSLQDSAETFLDSLMTN